MHLFSVNITSTRKPSSVNITSIRVRDLLCASPIPPLKMIYAGLNVCFFPKTGSIWVQGRSFVGCHILENQQTNEEKERETDTCPDLPNLPCLEKEDQDFESISCPPAGEKREGPGREAVTEEQRDFFHRIHSYPRLLRLPESRQRGWSMVPSDHPQV